MAMVKVPGIVFYTFPLVVGTRKATCLGMSCVSVKMFFLLNYMCTTVNVFLSTLARDRVVTFVDAFNVLLVLCL